MSNDTVFFQGLAFALTAAAVMLAWLGMQTENDLAETWAERERAYELADELRRSSDDLTRMARTYAVTGDERYRQWFQEILDIRNGGAPRPADYHSAYWDIVTGEGAKPREAGEPKALRDLMETAGFTGAELALLERSENESNALTALENEAFEAVRAGDREKARELLHSDAYHQAKAAIMSPLLEFFQKTDERLTAQLERRMEQQGRLNMFFFMAAVPLLIVAFRNFVLAPGEGSGF